MNFYISVNENLDCKIGDNTDNSISRLNKKTSSDNIDKKASSNAYAVTLGETDRYFEKNNKDGVVGNKDEKKRLSDVEDVTLMKNYMTVMSSSLSDEDFAKLRENGFKPSEMEPDEMVTVVDRIKANVAKSGKIVYGYNDDIDAEVLSEIVGSEVYANAIKSAFVSADIPILPENIENAAAALEESALLVPISEDAIKYLIENNMNTSIGDIYKAEHVSGNVSSGKYTDSVPSELITRENIENFDDVLEAAGSEIDENGRDCIRNMLVSGIEITEENVRKYISVKKLNLPPQISDTAEKIADTLKAGKNSLDTDLTQENSMYNRAEQLYQEIKTRLYTEETRLSLSVASTYLLLKNGINVDLTDLNLLVDNLKEAENRQFEAIFGANTGINGTEALDLLDDTISKMDAVKDMPIAAAGLVSYRSTVNIDIIYEEGLHLKASYEKAGIGYETMMTQVRGDLGDSIKKAFGNVPDILRELDLEVNEKNERSVRVLGYNSMEITKESVEDVGKTIDRIREVIDKMTPAKVISLIREGVNPLKVSLDDLSEKLDSINAPGPSPDRFAQYLCKLEQRKEITEDERAGFIGIYRLINAVEKNDMSSVGMLLNSDMDINFANLLTAVRSNKSRGLELLADDVNGEIERIVTKGVSISEQINRAFVDMNSFEDNSSEEENLDDNEKYREYIREEENLIRHAGKADSNDVTMLKSLNIPATVENIAAMGELKENGLYSGIRRRLRDSGESLDRIISHFAEHFSDEEAETAYSEMNNSIMELVNDAAIDSDSIADLRAMSRSIAGLRISQRFAEEDYYRVPVIVKGDTVDVNVRLKKGSEKSVRISFYTETLGNVNSIFGLKEQTLKGLISTDYSEGYAFLREKNTQLIQDIEKMDLNVENIDFVKSDKHGVNFWDDYVDEYSNDKDNFSNGVEDSQSRDAKEIKILFSVAKTVMTILTD